MQKKFFYFFQKTTSLFDLKSCCRGLWGKKPQCSLKIEYTFIRYVKIIRSQHRTLWCGVESIILLQN